MLEDTYETCTLLMFLIDSFYVYKSECSNDRSSHNNDMSCSGQIAVFPGLFNTNYRSVHAFQSRDGSSHSIGRSDHKTEQH